MKESTNEFIEPNEKNDKRWMKLCLYRLIKIANMVPLEMEVPDYEIVLQVRYANKTGQLLNLSSSDNQQEALNTVSEVWNEIKERYPELAKYAALEAYNSVIGDEVFEKVPSPRDFREHSGKKSAFSAYSPEVVKLQNFIRLIRLANNMRCVAYRVYWIDRLSSPTVLAPNVWEPIKVIGKGQLLWKEVHYTIPGGIIFKFPFSFDIYSKNKNNKEMGKIKFNPSFIERILNDTDVLQIKTCRYCSIIFFAEPRNMKFCSQECNNRMKSKRHYNKKKRSALDKR